MACLEILYRFKEPRVSMKPLAGDRLEIWGLVPDEGMHIGRTMDAHIFTRDEQSTSRRHCRLDPVDDGFTIRDLGSTRGTFVNDLHFRDPDEPHRLGDGDLIYLGDPSEPVSTARFHADVPTFWCHESERALLGAGSVYADWLEDRGDLVRAAFVREREQLSRMTAGPECDAHIRHCLETIDLVDPAWRFEVLRSSGFRQHALT